MLARRDWLKIYDDRIECGIWEIPYAEVKEAIVYKTRQGFIPVKILVLSTEDGNFQFGVNPWSNPFRHMAIPLRQESMKLEYSLFSTAIRVLVVGYLVYWACQRWL